MTNTVAIPAIRVTTLAQALFTAGLGLAILWAVGFSQFSPLHNAAHDTRHSNGFPCH
jgi:cobalt transporter subunit CbtB